ncbi:hypothetical protein A3C21_01285 [Candidatus Kaiserbacteria bacterium RIFCSPHIGHO2_02_FULL_59_21]|uniref:CMP/dCMP-type deaminase domain-containing protein n=2 Tax=Candidatus Kaiseribacteriota TaxID=1752734 RepID=A0A1F6E179_9BACT|nr:MAG: hypothetical protein A2766_02015 [Candidatus Kaiserbacteria bacterium RIFCSPHIGHO2_01_FULL_58_22]OGG67429.1 MAG: hypothetical protein A3C21_01285 [Candidatus Kaiserbacteria bacterium RIFCSPHIGHO2_02_FULL_59_21]OGG80689.1 MAG: hypothetical protein A2952_00455 [Candidatus Kaiserbacteria bacterium RIFCSPLOWO2_01_FULL_59_34]OGG85804.1 MAG: hypothetical protein A3I47_00205 [Candidatus Kaiserbacteria bacterium RIFCSPLOWO2_02_FULL_59_19]
MTGILYPYIPPGKTIMYVGLDNEFMTAAKEFARENNTVQHVGAALVVTNGRVIGRGSIGAGVHGEQGGCIRERLNVPTGTRYDLCKGCAHEYHSEASAIREAKERGEDTRGADLYLWGHWWCCEPCWSAMTEAGIGNVYLLEGSERLFNKSSPGNVIGRQFETHYTSR